MEEKSKNSRLGTLKANRILYLVIIGVLCLSAIIIGITAAMNRPKDSTTRPPVTGNTDTETETETDTQPDLPQNAVPELVAPVSGTVCKMHDLDMPVYSMTMEDWRVHSGIDITAAMGSDVKVVADGTVDSVWEDPLMGVCVSVKHGGDVTSVYKNLGETLPAGIVKGASVKQNDVIGVIGETALIEIAEEPHLHFEVLVGAEAMDPLDYISEESQNASFVFNQADDYEDQV